MKDLIAWGLLIGGGLTFFFQLFKGLAAGWLNKLKPNLPNKPSDVTPSPPPVVPNQPNVPPSTSWRIQSQALLDQLIILYGENNLELKNLYAAGRQLYEDPEVK